MADGNAAPKLVSPGVRAFMENVAWARGSELESFSADNDFNTYALKWAGRTDRGEIIRVIIDAVPHGN